MPGEEAVIHCEKCGKELDRGDHLIYSVEVPLFCANCRAENEAIANWEEALVERQLQDEYDQQVRGVEWKE